MENSVMTAAASAADLRTQRRVEAQNILRRSVVLVLSCSFLGNHRKVQLDDAVKAATGTDTNTVSDDVAEQLHITKRLVDAKVLSRANAVPAAAKAYLRTKAIPAHRVFGERAYLVPSELVEEVDAALEGFAASLAIEANKVADDWDEAVAKQAIALGSLFNAKDYPTREQVRQAYSIDWTYVSFGAPERLEHVSRAIFERTQRKFEGQMADAFGEVKLVLRETLLELTRTIADKLRPTADGKPKVFRNSILDGLTGFLSTFSVRNISDDTELASVVETLKGLTRGVDPQALRDIDAVRADVLRGVQEATGQLDALVQTGRRGISFGSL